ncbi:MAG: pyrophosphate--fructose-6-phosphate 1-phosphotransferase, partial [Rhizobiaceae bacterium]|nr:pyrophosphate--fructose-6-phosphate 1-phosphotransferase [Rhizobiaceae bacterium]
ERVLVGKSGYFARSAPANAADRKLIAEMAELAVRSALEGVSGLTGHDIERNNELRAIEFPRVKGGKHFDPSEPWFVELQREIGQLPG